MTAEQIMDQIKQLDPQDQKRIIYYVYQLDAERKLSGAELSSLAKRFVEATDEGEAARVREEITRGFYGRKSNA